MSDTTQKEFTAVLGDVVEVIGDAVVPVAPGGTGQDVDADILVCRHDQHLYLISVTPRERFARVTYRYHLLPPLASKLTSAIVENITGKQPKNDECSTVLIHGADFVVTITDHHAVVEAGYDEVELPPELAAAKELLETIDPELMIRFRHSLAQELSAPEVETTVTTTDAGAVSGFRIERKVFPTDPGFSITEFNHTAQAVLSIGTCGANTINTRLLPRISPPDEQPANHE